MTDRGNERRQSRRVWLVGVAALLAGMGVAMWRWRESPVQAEGLAQVWGVTVTAPDGQTLSLSSLRGKPLLLNFWATWCPPCVEELPMIDAFWRQHAPNGVQVIALAVDRMDSVKAFLRKHLLHMPVGVLGSDGLGLAKTLGNVAGGLPFSVFLTADGQIYKQKLGKLTEADLEQWLKSLDKN